MQAQELVCDRIGLIEAGVALIAYCGSRLAHLEIRRESQRLGILVAPERRISSPVMTKMEAGRPTGARRAAIRVDLEIASYSRLRSAKSEGLPVWSVWPAKSGLCGKVVCNARRVNAFSFLSTLLSPPKYRS